MTWWKVAYFVVAILVLIVAVQNMSWWRGLIGLFFIYLGVIAK